MSNQDRKDQIEQLILTYLKRNPDASDTLEGITKWWLEMERIDSSVEQVAAACNHLQKLGLLKKIKRHEGKSCFKCTDSTIK